MVLVLVLFVDQKRWSEMFPGIVAGVSARGAISGGVIGSHLQLVSSHAYFFFSELHGTT